MTTNQKIIYKNFMSYFKELRIFWSIIIMDQVQECIKSEKGTSIKRISFDLFHFMAHFFTFHTNFFKKLIFVVPARFWSKLPFLRWWLPLAKFLKWSLENYWNAFRNFSRSPPPLRMVILAQVFVIH